MVTYRKDRDLIFFDDASYTGVARDILDYVRRDMIGPPGGFYSAIHSALIDAYFFPLCPHL